MNDKVTLRLSEISLVPIKPTPDGLIGFCSFILCDHFYVGSVGLHSRPDGTIRLVYPEKHLPNGKTVHCFHPISKEAGSIVLSEVSKKYQQINGGNYPCIE